MVKKSSVGKVIGQVQGFKIRQKQSFRGEGKNKKVAGQDIGIYQGKKMVESGFKTKQQAIERAHQML